MSPEHFRTFADPLPEPMLLLTGRGIVLDGNHAVEHRLGVAAGALHGKHLSEIVADSTDEIAHYLRSCSRTRSLVLSSLSVRNGKSERIACRAEGTLLQPRTGPADAVLLLRLIPKESGVGQFVALNHRIDDLGREIHLRRQAEEAAHQRAEQLRVTLHSIGDAVIVTDGEGRVLLLNPVAEAITGWTLDEATGDSLPNVFHLIDPNTRERAENPAARAFQDAIGAGTNCALLVAKDGTVRPIENSSAPIRADDGALLGAVLVFRDVTMRQAAEEQLRRSERQFRQLADAMPQIVWSAQPDGSIDYINQQWSEFTGLPEGLGNEAWAHVLHPDEAPLANAQWAASVQSGAPFEMPLRLLDKRRKTFRWHLLRTVAVHDAAGEIVRWFGTATDIHQQKQAEESSRYLAESSAALATVVDYESTLQTMVGLAVPHFADWSSVDVTDDDGTLRRLAVAHKDPQKIELAHELVRLYPPDPEAPSGAAAVLRTGTAEIVSDITDETLVALARDETHLRLLRSLGLRSSISVPLIVSGRTRGVLSFVTAESGRQYTDADLALATDLAHRASVAVENTQLYQALRDADRRKDEFLATLAHELRNPLAPIRNALEILKLPRIDAVTMTRWRDMIERQVEHLVRLVDDLLDVSRVMKGKIELRRERIELAAIVARAVETVQPLMETQRHRLSVQLPAESLLIDGDPVRLAQVVGNLLTNAAKYTEPGGRIWLSAQLNGDTVELRVRDAGIGMVPEMLPRVFELFVQVDHTSTKAQGGLGIGLTLVKNLVELHNGTIDARSEGLGQGSEFIVRLPSSAQATDPDHGRHPDAPPRQSPAPCRLLVVDDSKDAAASLAMLLELQGHEVRVAVSGLAALEVTKSYTPDVVFLDIGMPGMDGYEVARRMREEPGLANVTLAALTGWGQREDRRRTSEAGFSHHLVKPPDATAVAAVLAQLQPQSAAQ